MALGVNFISIFLTLWLMPETVENPESLRQVFSCLNRRETAETLEIEMIDDSETAQKTIRREPPGSGWALVREKNLLLVMLLYAGIGLGDISFVESFALWSILSAQNGYLGFREVHIGITIVL